VLVVVADDGTERLLPFVNAVVIDVDVAAKRIRVEWEADW
jgi:16S rRNA processing protein RimM